MSLDAEMRQLLAEMALLSETSAARVSETVHGGAPDNTPRGRSKSLADEYHRRYNGAWGDRGRREVITDGRQALDNAKRMPLPVPEKDPEPTMDSPMWKRWIAEHPDSNAKLAARFGVSRQYIFRVRQKYAAPSQ